MRVSKQATFAGALRHKIEIQDRQTVPGVTDHTEKFTTVATTQAAIKTLTRGVEIWDGQNLSGVGSHRITVRHRQGVSVDQWVLFGDRRFRILTIQSVDERQRFQNLLCVERGSKDFAVNTQ